ncbi:MAG: RNA-binding cell elongation regulator Jag/EloR [Clostridia bacterium]|nr:RNA-binding cell elongation regulator Jag/EloR [Clostridia bacterium]
MKFIETSGKTVEDAIRSGLKELGCDLGDVNIDILEKGSPGLFGMFGRLAKVRLTVKEADPAFDIEMPRISLDLPKAKPEKKAEPKPRKEKPAKEAKPEPKKEAPAPKPEKKPEPKEEPKPVEAPAAAEPQGEPREKPAQPKKRENRPPRQRRERGPKPQGGAPVELPEIKVEPAETLPPTDLETLSEAGRKALDFLTNMTTKMGVQVEIRVADREGNLMIQMYGDTLGVLIGRRGETLDALQYLTSLYVNRGSEDYIRVSLDTEHYRAKREEALRKLAMRMANRARKSGHRVALEPMNPYERRILHSALQNHPYVTTHSEGEEPYRRVIITLK